MRRANIIIVAVVAVAAILAAALILGRLNGYAFPPANAANSAAANGSTSDVPFLSSVLGSEQQQAAPAKTWAEATLGIFFRLLLAVLLSSVLAFRPRKNFPLFQRNLSVSQTQILLSVVAAALMLIVGDNAARAFAIFAAVSIVRFRTNIRDPKEVTVLLISLALGLSSGVGRWELGIALCFFSLVLLYFLEYNEQEKAFRSMELKVKTRNTEGTQELLRRLFKKYKLEAEIREIVPPDEKSEIGTIQYYLNLRLNLSTDLLSDKMLAADKTNIEGIQWSKTKNATDIYQ